MNFFLSHAVQKIMSNVSEQYSKYTLVGFFPSFVFSEQDTWTLNRDYHILLLFGHDIMAFSLSTTQT